MASRRSTCRSSALEQLETGVGTADPGIIYAPTDAINQPFSRAMLARSWTRNPHSVALLDLLLKSSGKPSPSHGACSHTCCGLLVAAFSYRYSVKCRWSSNAACELLGSGFVSSHCGHSRGAHLFAGPPLRFNDAAQGKTNELGDTDGMFRCAQLRSSGPITLPWVSRDTGPWTRSLVPCSSRQVRVLCLLLDMSSTQHT